MSNWSRIMILWSEENGNPQPRIHEIIEAHAQHEDTYQGMTLISGVGDPDTDDVYSCETTCVLEANHFDPTPLLDVLLDLEWEFPAELEVMVKSETNEHYRVFRLQQTGRGKTGLRWSEMTER